MAHGNAGTYPCSLPHRSTVSHNRGRCVCVLRTSDSFVHRGFLRVHPAVPDVQFLIRDCCRQCCRVYVRELSLVSSERSSPHSLGVQLPSVVPLGTRESTPRFPCWD